MGWEFRFFKKIDEEDHKKILFEWKKRKSIEVRTDAYFLVKNFDHGIKIRNCSKNRHSRLEIKVKSSTKEGVENWSKIMSSSLGSSPLDKLVGKSIIKLKKKDSYLDIEDKEFVLNICSKNRTHSGGFTEVTLIKCEVATYNIENETIRFDEEKTFFAITKSLEGSFSNIIGKISGIREKEKIDCICGYPEFLYNESIIHSQAIKEDE